MTTLESLQAKIQKLQAQAEALATKKSSVVIEKIKHLMAEHGLTTADIDAHIGSSGKRGRKLGVKAAAKSSASAAKYRDPKTGATWTGQGRAPAWIANAKDRSKFLVEGNAVAASAPAAKKAAKVGNYVRGPQPAMYRDLKSGATWSGRGRAPKWIAAAKDRSKFLIAGGAQAAAASAGAVSKAKVAVKKAPKAVGATSTTGQPKGPQPAKYRDPKSGATWSGRGPAPAWLASVNDRSRFLVDGAGSATTDAGLSNKSARKSGVVAKKAAAKKAVGPFAKRRVVKNAARQKAVAVKAVATTAEAPAVKEASLEMSE
ncbi:H-NS family nucleoid-associated regulatory protein [Paraburkholderia fungorum]|uniref:H-NS family nucleoid-associated regulatory protein n=1 Tax=Paraburkholderia fungorum TaxID=134537 RepID=UPI00387837EA